MLNSAPGVGEMRGAPDLRHFSQRHSEILGPEALITTAAATTAALCAPRLAKLGPFG